MAEFPRPDDPAREAAFAVMQIRAQAREIERLAELYATTSSAQIAARKQILDLERQALEIERQQAKTKEQQLKADEKLKDNAHEQAKLKKQEAEHAQKRKAAIEQENSAVTKMQRGVSLLKGYWQEVTVAVYAMVRGIQAADDMMQKAFSGRAIMGNLPYEIDQARKATLGLVGDMDLARMAVQANRFGVASSAEELATLADAATKLGLSIGQDAQKSFEDLTLALARGSPLILDNMGIILKKSQAYELYAQKLGKSVSALTEQERAEAFAKIGLEKAQEAAAKVNLTINDQEKAWIRARQQWDKLSRETIPRLTAQSEGMWSGLADGGEILEDLLPLLVGGIKVVGVILKPVVAYFGFWAKQLAVVGRLAGELGSVFDFLSDKIGDGAEVASEWFDGWVGDGARTVRDTFSGLADDAGALFSQLREDIEEQIPAVKHLTDAWDLLKDAILETPASGQFSVETVSEVLGEYNRQKARQEYHLKVEEQTEARKLSYLEQQVANAEFAVKLGEAQGRSAEDLETAYHEQLQAKIALLRITEGQAAVEQLLRDEEIRQAGLLAKAGRGGGRGPTDAERMQSAGEIQIKIWKDRLKLMELEADLRGTVEDTSVMADNVRLKIAIEELELERQVLSVTRAKTSVERERNEARKEAIDREIEFMQKQQEIEIRERANKLIGEAVEATKKQAAIDNEIARQEAAGLAEIIDLEDYRHKRAADAIRVRGETAAFHARTERGQLEAIHTMESELHQNRMQQMRREYDAEVRSLDARQQAAESMDVIGDPQTQLKQQDEFREIAHDREMARLEFEMDVRRAMESEQIAMQQRDRARMEQFWAKVEEHAQNFQQFTGTISNLTGFLSERTAAEQDANLQRTINSLKAQGEAKKEQFGREIEAAEGNVARQNELRRQQTKQEATLQRQIEKAQAEHQDRRKRQEMKAAGFQMLITGAVETVKAIAAFAGFNYVEGALHVAAAAVAYAQGAMLVSGKIPGGGAVANLSAGGGGMSAGESSQEYIDPSTVPGSVPGEAARRESATPQDGMGKGGNVINIYGDINSLGTIDQDAAENIGRTLGKVAYSREV